MTRRTLILVAGLPGTGKSRLGERIRSRFAGCREVSIDAIKEELWDTEGFEGPEEKRALDARALEVYVERIDRAMREATVVLSDYPFSIKQGPALAALCRERGFTPVTVRLVADLDVLYTRQRNRDLDASRHPGHVLTRYRPGEMVPVRTDADGLLTRQEFHRRCTTRGYDTFSLGDLLEVDMTDFSTVDHDAILTWLAERVEG